MLHKHSHAQIYDPQTAVYPAPTPNIPMVCPTRTDAWHDGRAFTIIPDELGTFNARVGVVDFALHSCAPHAPPGVAMTELLAGEGCLQDPDASVLMCSPRWSISLSLPVCITMSRLVLHGLNFCHASSRVLPVLTPSTSALVVPISPAVSLAGRSARPLPPNFR
jgi:hypothetical protein